MLLYSSLFFFNDTATTEIYTLSLHDALPILPEPSARPPLTDDEVRTFIRQSLAIRKSSRTPLLTELRRSGSACEQSRLARDRKSIRLNSSHANNSYALFCLKNTKTHHSYVDL